VTDGSRKGATEEGDAAAVITTGAVANPVVLKTIKMKGGKCTCSYEDTSKSLEMSIETERQRK
jgi:hypothetical protein